MKGKEFIDPDTKKLIEAAEQIETETKRNSGYDTCPLCNVHTQAWKKIPKEQLWNYQCPHCKKYIGETESFDGYLYYSGQVNVIGETNSCNMDILNEENFEKAIIIRCPECDNYSVPILTPISYNANHDVYYTSGIDGMGDYANVYVHNNFGCIHGIPKYIPKFEWYIRSQDGINESDMERRSAASGYRFSAQDAYAAFGEDLRKIDDDIHEKGSAIIVYKYDIYQILLNELLVKRNITYEELDSTFHFTSDLRNSHIIHSVWDWIKVCNYFGVNPISFGYYSHL